MNKLDLLLVILLNIIGGCSFTFVGYSVLFYAPAFLYFLRFFSTGILTVGFNKFPKIYIPNIIVMSFLQAFLFYSVGLGIKNIDSSTIAILTRLDVIFTILLSSIFLKEELKIQTILGFLICILAVYILCGDIAFTNLKYIILTILGCIASAGTNIVAKTIKNTNNNAIVSWSSIFIGIIMLMVSILTEGSFIIRPLNIMSIFSIIYLGIFSTYIAYLGLYYLLRKYEASKIMPYNFTRPIFSMIFGFLFLSEPITIRKIIGIIMIVFGIYISEFYHNKENFIGKNYEKIKIYFLRKFKNYNVEYISKKE